MALTAQVVELAKAARAEGVLVVRMRRGPIAELQLLPPDPPELAPKPTPADEKDISPDERRRREAAKRDAWLREEG